MADEDAKGAVDLTRGKAMAIAALAAAGIYNAVEIYILILSTFRQRRGRYFWSVVVANTGIVVHAGVSLAHYLRRSSNVVPGAFALLSWVAMVTGQSVVLWSRLHLVVYSRTWIRLVLALVIADACAMHVPMVVLWVLCWATPREAQSDWVQRYGVYEKVSIVVFTLQEALLTGIFARQGFFNLKPLVAFKTRSGRLIPWYLLSLFILVFLLDIGLVVLDYTNNFVFQMMSKPLMYSIKLKVEFMVLNKLLAFTRMNSCDCHHLGDRPAGQAKGVFTTDTNTTTKRDGANGGQLTLPDSERTDHIFDG